MNIRRIIIAVLGSLGLVAFATVPAFAAGGPSGSVAVSGSVAEECGFASVQPTLSFGTLAPSVMSGTQTSGAPVAYYPECNDSAGFNVTVSDAGATVTGNPAMTFPYGIYSDWNANLTASNPTQYANPSSAAFTGVNVPTIIDQEHGDITAYTAGLTALTDTWFATLPATEQFPGTLSDTFTYSIVGS